MESDNVRIASGALPPLEYDEMLRSADIGLALYRPSHETGYEGRNIATIGLSSGKLSSYARAGVPALCGGNPELRDFLDKYAFGEYVHRLDEIPRLAERIMGSWSRYHGGAKRFYAEQLDFDRFWPEVWERMRELVARSRTGTARRGDQQTVVISKSPRS